MNLHYNFKNTILGVSMFLIVFQNIQPSLAQNPVPAAAQSKRILLMKEYMFFFSKV